MDIEGKVGVITGAASGIGRAAAIELQKQQEYNNKKYLESYNKKQQDRMKFFKFLSTILYEIDD